MSLYHPKEPIHFQHRNKLLQQCLRPDPLPFPIEQEYPIVLAPEGQSFSYCHDFQNQLCSHANLWPRKAINALGQDQFLIGLVGNVATDPRFRGHGHMRSLLTAVEEVALQNHMQALFLWSDLTSFYQKLGFVSVGQEYHFHFLESRSSGKARTAARLVRMDLQGLTDDVLKQLLSLRPKVGMTLERSLAEFRRMLEIPWIDLYVAYETADIVAFAIQGKGYDMMGVIHEWGCTDAAFLLDLVHFVRRDKDLAQCMLLTPGELKPAWHQEILAQASAVEAVPMALMRILKEGRESELAQLFIWGLDSI
ncbi:MAG TPA: GNAT family N-acetyltransferase [Oligoflexus sp.]|uniref:GNAT family N-acetyltransferase n=1 Tax=Oligoflexus sp. TaxID=1971216 RepID=UPI002D62418D|nr:GNAT family N-acetyltransferase [Oligoflexus sp.]HYX39877.1 GNAT family N-acetyltransferase [Oligoflexus sp.]